MEQIFPPQLTESPTSQRDAQRVKVTLRPCCHIDNQYEPSGSPSISFLPLRSNSILNSGNIPNLGSSIDHPTPLARTCSTVQSDRKHRQPVRPSHPPPYNLLGSVRTRTSSCCRSGFGDTNEQSGCVPKVPYWKTASLCRLEGAERWLEAAAPSESASYPRSRASS